MLSTTIPAIVSVGLNVLFLPHFGFIGAAIVSVLTESLVWLIQLYYTRHYLKEVPIIGSMTKLFCICCDVWPFATCKTIPTFHPLP